MFFDLNVPVVAHQAHGVSQPSKKSKGKQQQQKTTNTTNVFTAAQVAAIEARIDLLVHLGYTAIALNQTIEKKIDPKTHLNVLDVLLPQLRSRNGIVFMKRLTIQIDEESEKGFGLTSANASIVDGYDLIALSPSTAATFSAACLTHSQPSPLTAHIISLPLTQPRLPFHLKHTLVRTALKNGAVFEINYAGALGDPESSHLSLGVDDTGSAAKRNWWAAAREVVRVTKGKGVLVSGGVMKQGDYRGPKDVQNLIVLLGLAQNLAHETSTTTAKSLLLRAQTRKTYRAVLSEPRIVVPEPSRVSEPAEHTESVVSTQTTMAAAAEQVEHVDTEPSAPAAAENGNQPPEKDPSVARRKRRREPEPEPAIVQEATSLSDDGHVASSAEGAPARKKKKKKKKDGESERG